MLGLPANAVTYLSTHGALDAGHINFFANVVNRLDEESDRNAVVHVAKRVYHLYGDVLRSVPIMAREHGRNVASATALAHASSTPLRTNA